MSTYKTTKHHSSPQLIRDEFRLSFRVENQWQDHFHGLEYDSPRHPKQPPHRVVLWAAAGGIRAAGVGLCGGFLSNLYNKHDGVKELTRIDTRMSENESTTPTFGLRHCLTATTIGRCQFRHQTPPFAKFNLQTLSILNSDRHQKNPTTNRLLPLPNLSSAPPPPHTPPLLSSNPPPIATLIRN